MSRLFRFIFQLISLAVVLCLLTALWIVVDGVSDAQEKSDVGLYVARPGEVVDSQLDHLAELYKDGEISAVLLCEQEGVGQHERSVDTTKYLVKHGVPASSISVEKSYLDTWDMAQKVSNTLKMHEYGSVMLIADYYRMTRLKVALRHEGVTDIHRSHVGSASWNDFVPIAGEVIKLYDYIGRTFLLPAAEKVKEEAKVGVDKVQSDAHDAKKSVDHGLDNLSK